MQAPAQSPDSALSCSQLVRLLDLKPHPEGGFFAEIFRDTSVHLSKEHLPETFKVGRSISTAIYFLVPAGTVSRLHRIPSFEVWHFYAGEPLTVFEIHPDGSVKHTVLGTNLEAGHRPVHIVPPGVWFGSFPTLDYTIASSSVAPSSTVAPSASIVADAGSVATADRSDVRNAEVRLVRGEREGDRERSFSLVGCTVAPAFEFADFEMAKKQEMIAAFPHAKGCIEVLADE